MITKGLGFRKQIQEGWFKLRLRRLSNALVESGAIFDFRREMEEYCRSDVDILRRGCACFRRELINISELVLPPNKAWRHYGTNFLSLKRT